jgi:hypothetical protein
VLRPLSFFPLTLRAHPLLPLSLHCSDGSLLSFGACPLLGRRCDPSNGSAPLPIATLLLANGTYVPATSLGVPRSLSVSTSGSAVVAGLSRGPSGCSSLHTPAVTRPPRVTFALCWVFPLHAVWPVLLGP